VTWLFHAGSWVKVAPSVSPPGRYDAGVAYDSADRYVVMFGGWGVSGALGDTWKFDATGWHNITTRSHPPARVLGAMANDLPDRYVVLYGGQTGAVLPILYNDTWTFQAGNWTQVVTARSPSAFQAHEMQMDRADGYVLLFGGQNLTSSLPSNETWKFAAGIWTKIVPFGALAPLPRFYAGLAFDPQANAVVLFGGGDGGNIYNDTWEYSTGNWTFVV
jgi:hypothetical protein